MRIGIIGLLAILTASHLADMWLDHKDSKEAQLRPEKVIALAKGW